MCCRANKENASYLSPGVTTSQPIANPSVLSPTAEAPCPIVPIIPGMTPKRDKVKLCNLLFDKGNNGQ